MQTPFSQQSYLYKYKPYLHRHQSHEICVASEFHTMQM